MERRTKIVFIAAAALVVLGILALFLRPRRAVETSPQAGGALSVGQTGTLSRSGGIVNVAPSTVEAETPLPPPSAAVAARQLAMTFAERYGSFSSEGNFVNVEDVYPLMTERYQRRSEAEVARQRATGTPTAFHSTTTVVIRADVDLPSGETSTTAVVQVTTQRTEARGGQAPRTYGQNLTVKLLKAGDEWRVDDAVWGPEVK